MADTDLQQFVVNVGTTAQIEAGISGGTITSDMLSIATDATDYATTSDIANMQTTTNLVTSVNSLSTDTEYPSAKCLYTNISKTIGIPDYTNPSSLAASTIHTILENGWIATSGTVRLNSKTGKQLASGGAYVTFPVAAGTKVYVAGVAANFFPCL